MSTIASRDPEPGQLNVGIAPFVQVSIHGQVLAPVAVSDISISMSGVNVIVNGQVQAGFTASFTPNAGFGFDVSFRSKTKLPDNRWHSVRVQAPDLDAGWVFRTVEATGPRLLSVSPAIGVDSQPSYPLVSFVIADDGGEVRQRTLLAESDDGELSGSQLTCASIDLRHALGSVVEIDGNPAFVISVIGPNIVATTYSGGGSGLNVKLFKKNGIDVAINGARVITSGEVIAGSGWDTGLVETDPGVWTVTAQKTGEPIPSGTRVDIDVRAQDSNADVENVSTLRSHFFVGDTVGPAVGSVTPAPGTRGLDTDESSTQPSFDIIDRQSGVDIGTINVTVDGVLAIENGVAIGEWTSSLIQVVAGGVEVVLVKDTAWPSEHEVFVSVTAADVIGNEMPESTWLWHFGVTVESFTANVVSADLVSDDVVRVVAFDFSGSSFAKPSELEHNGFAADGYWYDDGTRDTDHDRASWATEASSANRSARDGFPVSGYVVLTSGSWVVLDASGRMWMRCAALGSGDSEDWSMAGGVDQELRDVAVSSDAPMVFLASGPNVIVVDFRRDQAWRVTVDGREISSTDIAARAGNAVGGSFDASVMLASTTTDIQAIACVASRDSWVAICVRDAQIEICGVIDDDLRAEIEALRGEFTATASSVVLPVPAAALGGWTRVLAKDGFSLAVFTSTAGDAHVVTFDWISVFAYLQSYDAVLQTPVTGEDAVDADVVVDEDGSRILALATQTQLQLIEVEGNGLQLDVFATLSLATLTLDLVVGGQLSAVCLGDGFSRERGFVFVAASAVGDGETVRWRHEPASADSFGRVTTMSSGDPVASLASLGETRLGDSGFVRASMDLLASNEAFVLSAMIVE